MCVMKPTPMQNDVVDTHKMEENRNKNTNYFFPLNI